MDLQEIKRIKSKITAINIFISFRNKTGNWKKYFYISLKKS